MAGGARSLGCPPRRPGVPAVPVCPDSRCQGASGSGGGFAPGQSSPWGRRPTAAFPAVGGWVAGPAAWLQITGEADPIGAAGALPFKAGSSGFMAEARMVPGVREQSERPRRRGSALGVAGGCVPSGAQLSGVLGPWSSLPTALAARGGCNPLQSPCSGSLWCGQGQLPRGGRLPLLKGSTCPWPWDVPAAPGWDVGPNSGGLRPEAHALILVSAFAAPMAPKGCFSRAQRAPRLSPPGRGFLLTPALAGSPQGPSMRAQPAEALPGCEICCCRNENLLEPLGPALP